MKMLKAAGAALILLLCGAGQSADVEQPSLFQVRQSFDVQAPYLPSLLTVGKERRLVYELHLTSFSYGPLTLTSITATDERTGRTIARLEGSSLAAATDRLSVEPGRRAIIYLDLPLDLPTPASLVHRVEFEAPGLAGRERAAVYGGSTQVGNKALPLLGPPLRGGPWVAVYDPMLANGHRRVVYAVGGRARIPGRHAVDWMRPDRSQGTAKGNDQGAGAEVLAVADGVIVSAHDGVPEFAPDAPRTPMRLSDATGNYIALDLGNGRYAFYEHLMPGLSVKRGDRVRRGQVIGRLGSTGQASRPHLHFHIADSDSPLGSEGLPYRLENARVIGSYPSIAAFEKGGPWLPASGSAGSTLPTPNAVVMFPD